MPCCKAAARCANKQEEDKPEVHKVTLRRRGVAQQTEELAKTAGGAGSRVCKILNEWK